MALLAIVQLYLPLSPEEASRARLAALQHRRAAAATTTTSPLLGTPTHASAAGSSPSTCTATETDDEADGGFSAYPPLGVAPPLAFAAANPACRVAAEAAQQGVRVAYTVYSRPDPPVPPSSGHVWCITPPPTPQLRVCATRLPLRTSGLAEGAWWLRRLARLNARASAAAAGFSSLPADGVRHDLRLVIEGSTWPTRRHLRRQTADKGRAETGTASCSSLPGSHDSPATDQELFVFGQDSDALSATCEGDPCLPFTSLEVQQLYLRPSAMRVLPCLFGPQVTCVLFAHCVCQFDPSLRDAQTSRYEAFLSDDHARLEDFGLSTTPTKTSEAVRYRYGATRLSYLGASGCSGEGFWPCLARFFLAPQCTPVDAATVTVRLSRLSILDISDNKSLSVKHLRHLLQSVLLRNTVLASDRAAAGAAAVLPATEHAAQPALIGLCELNVSWTRAIQGIHWKSEFAGLGCRLRRLSIASCGVTGDAVIDILCAGDAAAPLRSPISVAAEPFSAEVRRLQLLDVRWNVSVTGAAIDALRDDHVVHCQHLRVAGTAIGRAEADRFATLVTP